MYYLPPPCTFSPAVPNLTHTLYN